MIIKQMFLKTSDKTNLKWMKTLHLYKGFNRSKSKIGFFLKASAKKVKPPKIEYKGFKRKFFKKGDLVRSLIIKSIFSYKFESSLSSKFKNNSTVLIKKKNVLRSKYFSGLISKNIKKKKFIVLFNKNIKGYSLMVELLTFNQTVMGSNPVAPIGWLQPIPPVKR